MSRRIAAGPHVSWAIPCILVALSACATQLATTPPLPPHITITAPGPDIPEPVAAFAGVWKGHWDPPSDQSTRRGAALTDQTLVVQRIAPLTGNTYHAGVISSWGEGLGRAPAFVFISGTIGADGVLRLLDPSRRGGLATYTMAADRQTIVTQYSFLNRPNATVTARGILRRTHVFPE